MFGKLKNKLKDWTKNISKKAEEVEEEIQEVEETKEEVKPKEDVEKLKEIKEKTEKKSKSDKKAEKQAKKEQAKEKKQAKREEKKAKKEEKKKEKEEVKDIEVPQKFNVGTQKVEPDLEKVEEIVKKIETKEIKKPVKKIHKEVEKLSDSIGPSEEEKTVTEIIEEEKPDSEVPSKKSFFQKITSKVNKVKISEQDFDVYAEELEMLLIENNVALEVAEKIVKELRKDIVGKEMLKKEIEGQIQEYFKDIIRDILVKPFNLVDKIKNRPDKNVPYVVLFCGVNGTGKTTSIAKIAQQMKDNNIKPVLAAGDTFRAASIEQIKKHASKLDLKVIAHEYGSDPAAVGFDAIKYAEKNKIDVVLIDTAGRMHTEKNLMSQIEKVAKVTKPDTKIFVGESITGNDIIEQVRSFDWAVQIDGIILSKADIDEKGGTALSVGYVTKKPILYLGTGQEYDKIEPFDKEKFIKKLGLDDEN
jgi:fused signal recognition particle receptor